MLMMISTLIYLLFVLFLNEDTQATNVRLVGGNSTEGRLEVYWNGTWSNACYYSYFNSDERGPSVVCRMLGISWSGYFIRKYGNGNKTVSIRDIRCQTGLETDIDQCTPNDRCNGNCCLHNYDIGVSCYDDETPLRLNGKNSDSEGIVEVYLSTDMHWEWVPLCADGFGDQEAKVICQSLNFSTSGLSASSSQILSSDKTLNEYFNCQGSEKKLLQCTKEARTTCPSKQVAVVSCDHTEVRLTNGNSSNEGRLEVKHNGHWGNVCATGFDENDAKVVCRMLGFETRQVELMNYQQSGHGQGQVHLSNVACDGNEKDIKACANIQWNTHCNHNDFVEIECYATEIRLVNGKSPFEGRVEVKYNGTWGTVCDNGFSINNTKVVCRMLGIESKNPIKWNSAHFGQGKGRILMDNVVCLGNETDIATCEFKGWGHTDCSHGEDVSVQCIADVKISLISGTHNAWEGRLEVIIDGKHGTVDGRHFTQNMADRFCKYLGYNESNGFSYSSKFGRGSSSLPVWNLQSFFMYSVNPFIEHPVINNHYRDVGIECVNTFLRLVGGSSYNEGRIELQHQGSWGAICCDGFTRNSGDVICKQLGFIGLSSWSRTPYGRTAGKPMWVKNLACNGNEKDIAACNSDDWKIKSCSESCNVGVICEHNKVRLVNGSAPFQGRVEFYHNSEWGSIRSANDKLAHTVCRILGYNESDVTKVSILSAERVFGESTLELLTQSYCSEQLFDIERCMSDTGVNWTRSTGTHPSTSVRCKMNIRLSNGPSPSAGRVEIMRKNVWGTLCSSGMTENLATEVCKMVAAWPFTRHTTGKLMKNSYYGKGTGPVWKIRDGCHEDIAKCLLPDSEHIDCNHSDDAGVYCLTSISSRLSGGSHENEGRVELKYNNEWVGLCDIGWDDKDASAFCHSLGYWSTSATARKSSWFGQSTNQLWYTYPYCISTDISIVLCIKAHMYFFYGRNHCDHTHEAGASCVSTNKDRNSVKLKNGPGAWKGELIINLSANLYGGICWQFWNTNTNEVVCKTLGYRLQGQRFTSYRAEKTIYPLYLSELNCTGHEVNIGMCKGYYDVYNCTTDAVGIDCSGGIQVRLQNGTNPFEGRVEIFLGGVWNTLCDSSWNNYDAKAICSTLGIGTSTPVLLSNAHYGQGNTSRVIGDLGCTGWEDHIGQCNIIERGSCLHTEDAGVRCIDCYEEITTQSGEITSNNYPNYFSDKKDCIFVIKPAKIISSNVQYVLSIEDLRSQSNRDIEIKEGIYGSVLKHVTFYQPTDTVVGKEFFIRYTKTNTQTDRYKITWKLLERRDAIKIGCGPVSWDIAVNMTIMKKLYPDTIPELIYFPDAGCKGVWRDDTIFFSQKYTECRTLREDRVSSVLYKNRLMYPEANTPNPVVIRNFRWTIDVDCELSKINSATVNFHPNELLSTTVSSHGGHENVDHISGSGKEGVIISFYKDQHFIQQINGNPLQIHIGESIYVKVKTHTTDNNYKMRLHSCVAKPQSYSSASYAYPLIQDGCPTDSTTKIISQTTHETTFVFSSFEFQTNKDNVFVKCNATFCLTGDNSVACQQACHTKRSVARIPDTSFIEIGYSRPFRVLYVEDSSNHSHDVKHNVDQQKGSKQNILDKEESKISKI